MGWTPNKRIRQLAAVWQSLHRHRPSAYAHSQRELQFEIRSLEERRVLNGAPVAAHGQGHATHDNSQSIPGVMAGLLAPPGGGSNAQSVSPLSAKTSGAGHPGGSSTGTPPTNLPGTEGHAPFNLGNSSGQPATSLSPVVPQVSSAVGNHEVTPDFGGNPGGGNTISVPGPQTIDQDNPLVLSGVTLPGSNSDTYSVTIDWGDGNGTTSGTLTQDPTTPGTLDVQGQYSYGAPGSYDVTIAVTDVTTSTVYQDGIFMVTVNSPPTATDLTYSTPSDVTLNVTPSGGLLSGNSGSGPATAELISNSDGADGTLIVNPDGSFQYVPNGTLGTDTFTYQVSDGIDTATANLAITTTAPLTNTTPVQTFSAVEGASTGQVVLATFTDADPYAVASDYTVNVTNWGGATEGTPTVTVQELPASAAGSNWEVLGSTTYAEANFVAGTTYPVTVTVTDNTGGNSFTTSNTSFNVTDAALTNTTPVQTFSAVEGASTGQVVLATFTDADPYAVASDYTVNVTNWGGATEGTPTVTVQELPASAAGSNWEVLGSTTYAEANFVAGTTYPVTVTVTDNTGGNSFTTSNTSFNVTDAALTNTTPVQTFSAVEGASTGQVVLATFTDADPYAVASDYTVNVTNWGDATEGTPTVTVQELPASAAGSNWEVLGSTTYAEANFVAGTTYPVTVTVTDNTGGNSFTTSNTSFNVTDAALTNTTPVQTFSAVEGASTGQVVLATFTDADPYAVASDYTVNVTNWGDATEGTPTVTVQELPASAAGSNWEVLGSTTYAEANFVAGTTYPVTVTVTDNTGGNSFTTSNTSFNVTDAALTNTTPVQTFSAVEGASTGQVVLATFTDADPYAVASDYTVNVTNWGGATEGTPTVTVQELPASAAGSNWEVLGSTTYAEANFVAGTTYPVTVTVTDNTGGNTFTTSNTSFNVTDAALTNTTPVQTYSAVEGASTGQVVLATFTDADPYATASDYTVNVNWGGELRGASTVTIQEVSKSTTSSTWEVLGTATYDDYGSYNVTVQITDNTGGNSFTTSNTSFLVSDPAVIVTPVTLSIPVGANSGVQTVATFTDPGGPEGLSDYSATINWGDGTPTVAGTIVYNAATGVFSVQGSHVYGYDVSYPITVTVSHDVAPNATAVSTAVVTDVPPTLTTTPTYTSDGQGSVLTLTNINFSDPAFPVLSNSPTFTYSINWADGTPIQTGIAPVTQFGSVGVPTVGAFNLSHVYELAGDYAATLTIYDHDREVATDTIIIVVPEVPPVISSLSFTELNILSETTATGTVYYPGNSPVTVTINWGDNTTTTFTEPGGVSDTFVMTHTYYGPPNPLNPAAPISVTVAVNGQLSVFGQLEVGQVVTQAGAVQVPGTGVHFVTFFPEPKAPPLALAQTVLTERNSLYASQPLLVTTANDLIVVGADETGAAEDRVVLRLVSPDGKDANDIVLPGNVLDDLPGYLKRLPDGHYRVYYIQGDTHRERLIIDVNVRGGRPADADEDSGGTQDRPPNAQFHAPRPLAEEEPAGDDNAIHGVLASEPAFSRPALGQPAIEAPWEKPASLSASYGLLATSLLVARARSKATASSAPSPADLTRARGKFELTPPRQNGAAHRARAKGISSQVAGKSPKSKDRSSKAEADCFHVEVSALPYTD